MNTLGLVAQLCCASLLAPLPGLPAATTDYTDNTDKKAFSSAKSVKSVVQESVQSKAIHWAFRLLSRPELPRTKNSDRVRTPVDSFLLASLEENGLTFSPDADRLAFLRRASLDLIGLPPSPEELHSFLTDPRPDAETRWIDQLLASPHFGERWGRHWLDAAGYVDVLGGDNDAGTVKLGEGKWLYRDYAVRSFNADKPYDRFLLEQLAGDELADWRSAAHLTPDLKELLVATGFLRTASDDTDENELNTLDIRHGVLQRTGEILANNLLALTLQCAKCHDHKYEPISQREYYAFLANLSPAFDPQAWLQPKQRALPDVSKIEKAAIDRHNREIEQQVQKLKERQEGIRRPHRERLFEARLNSIPEPIRNDVRKALETEAEKRSEVQKYLAGKFEAALKVKSEEISAALSGKEVAELADLDRLVAGLQKQRRTHGIIQAVYDTGLPSPFHLLRRGNHETPGEEVQPGFLTVLCAEEASAAVESSSSEARGLVPFREHAARSPAFTWPGPPKGGTTSALPRQAVDSSRNLLAGSSGRRLALARWLTDPDSPASTLVARVWVNRIWQHLFGQGIVETSDNFGLSGSGPTHPQLLDWLASELIRQGWRTKPIVRLIMNSTVYRQSATASENPSSDPSNRLLWRQRLRRLESEIIRDAILAVSGKLDRTVGGAPIPLESRTDGLIVVNAKQIARASDLGRRSLYILARRNYHLSLLNTFDQPIVATSCIRRSPAAVVSQSLTMLNDAFVLEQAGHFADRVSRAVPSQSTEDRIRLAFELALTRPPNTEELRWCSQMLRQTAERFQIENVSPGEAATRALPQLCHTLLNTSEFLFAP